MSWFRFGLYQRPEKYSAIIYRDGNLTIAEVPERGLEYVDTDSATVIQNALNALVNGGVVFVKGGNYVISKTITIPYSNIVVEGEGSTVFTDNVVSGNLLTAAKDYVVLRGFKVVIGVSKALGVELGLDGSNYVVVSNVEVVGNGGGTGLSVSGNYILVAGCRLTNLGTGISISGASDYVLIVDNYLSGNATAISGVTNLGVNSRVEDVVGYPTDMFKFTGLSVAVGTGGVYGAASTVRSASNVIKYFKARITFGGTFGTGETVTAKVEAVYHDDTTAYVEKSATAVGSVWLSDDDILTLTKNASYITKLNFYAKSSLTSTTATVSVDVYGHG